MNVFATIHTHMPYTEVPDYARRVEAMGYDGIKVPETVHDGLLTSLLVVEHTRRMRVQTSVVLAFPRSPMLLAYGVWDLARFSQGRFALGLGTQVKGNIEGRFSVPWTAPIPRMREYLQSLRAIWSAFQGGTDLKFHGDHYNFTRLQPRFNPGPHEWPDIPLFLGAVNPAICRLAGELCNGIVTHPSATNPRFVEQITIPNLEAGAQRSGRTFADLELLLGGPIVTGATREEVARAREVARESFAFWFSTPPYWPTLDLYGWSELGPELRELTRQGRWQEMPSRISDELLDQLAPQGTYDEIADVLKEWFGSVAAGIQFPVPADPAYDRQVARVIERLQAA